MSRQPLFFLAFLLAPLQAGEIDFQRDIAPLLTARCLSCHAGETAEAGLDISHLEGVRAGGESGEALVPGDAHGSLLWKRIAADEMPEDQPLPDNEKALLQQWIDQGATWTGPELDLRAVSTEARAGFDWWSLQPLQQVELPEVANTAWPRNGIDRFVLHRLEQAELSPNPPATPAVLARRVHFDVVGLPPTKTQSQRTIDNYSGVIDDLLGSVTHGQHWARHWLDVVRFGESHGFEYNQPRNRAWAYRNWVIDAFNADLPYDEFVRLQIAGDLAEAQHWAATGFLVAGPHNTTKPSSDKMRKTMRHDELEDIVGAIGQTFLGLTINCARCHDHKFDPITQKEYYQLVASVAGVDHGERDLPDPQVAEARERRETLQKELTELQSALEKDSSDDSLKARIEATKSTIDELAKITATRIYMAVSQKPAETQWLKRGDVTTPIEVVTPGGLQAINRNISAFSLEANSSDGPRRQKLAAWLTSNNNPLLARVIVNRIWHYYFGQGLVRTPSDFGFNGDRPSHPELLDYLAAQLIQHDWRLKPIHRMILESATYQQSSRIRSNAMAVDADNRLLWRMAPKRLTAEQMRDAMLWASGKLDTRLGGAGYRDVREYKYRGSHYYDPVEPEGEHAFRRTVYRFTPRGAKRTILDTFDCPDPSTKTPQRQVTTTPLQALSLMNNAMVFQVADWTAARLQQQSDGPEVRIQKMFQWIYNRPPTDDEIDQAKDFLETESWQAWCRVLFNSNEFLYVR